MYISFLFNLIFFLCDDKFIVFFKIFKLKIVNLSYIYTFGFHHKLFSDLDKHLFDAR